MTTHTELRPRHIAIVMDGNGRWAKKRFLPRIAGHRAGVEAAREVTRNCALENIEVLSLFAFSSENWSRPKAEVSYLMRLFLKGLEREIAMLTEYNVRLRFIGNRNQFDSKLYHKIQEVEAATAVNSGMILIIAVDYGGQWDITQAAQQCARAIEAGDIKSDDMTAELISSKLSFADLPNPDLFIRTSGEMRISNFMLWQLAYSELYFTDILWPDFDKAALDKALIHFAKRDRRYGTVPDTSLHTHAKS